MLPAGTHFLMTVATGATATRTITAQHVQIVELATGQRRTLTEGRNPAYFSAGYLPKEAGREWEVYVQPYPGPGARVVVSQGGGIEPVWSPTGREIFYRSVDGRRLIAVDVQVTPAFSAETPRVLFEGPYSLGTSFWSDYDVFPGGQEFLMIAADAVGSEALHVAINWIAEVRPRLGNPE